MDDPAIRGPVLATVVLLGFGLLGWMVRSIIEGWIRRIEQLEHAVVSCVELRRIESLERSVSDCADLRAEVRGMSSWIDGLRDMAWRRAPDNGREGDVKPYGRR